MVLVDTSTTPSYMKNYHSKRIFSEDFKNCVRHVRGTRLIKKGLETWRLHIHTKREREETHQKALVFYS